MGEDFFGARCSVHTITFLCFMHFSLSLGQFLFLTVSGLYLFSLYWDEKWALDALDRMSLTTPVSAVQNTVITGRTGAVHFSCWATAFPSQQPLCQETPGEQRWHMTFSNMLYCKFPFHIQFWGHNFRGQFCWGSQAFSRAAEVSLRAVLTCTGWLSKLPVLFLCVLMHRKWKICEFGKKSVSIIHC